MKRLAALLLTLSFHGAFAQSASDVSDGTAFANSIAPTSTSQIVNPTAVSSTAWSGSTAVSSTVPSGLGGFSTPVNDSTALTTAQSSGLTAMGDQAQIDCANYVAGTDAYQNQYCAAVNFLNNQCMQATTGEQSVLGTTGTTQGATTNCAGTYGAGQSQFSYSDQVTSSDPMFAVTSGLATAAADTLTQTCTAQTVVTSPAQYETDTCTVSQDEEDNSCSQSLNTTVTNSVQEALSTTSCDSGQTAENGVCVLTIDYTPTISCPDGYIQGADDTCIQYSTLAGTQTCPSDTTANHTDNGTLLCLAPQFSTGCPDTYEGMPLEAIAFSIGETCLGDYLPLTSCPDGYTYDGTECTETSTIGATLTCPTGGSLSGQSCVTTSTTSATTTYSCPDGETLSGSQCITKTVSTTWTDTCGTYEQSAGVSLGVPQN